MNKIFNIIQIIIACGLVVSVILQQPTGGLGQAFGGEGNIYRTKRGAEKAIFIATVVLAVLFIGSAILRLLLL